MLNWCIYIHFFGLPSVAIVCIESFQLCAACTNASGNRYSIDYLLFWGLTCLMVRWNVDFRWWAYNGNHTVCPACLVPRASEASGFAGDQLDHSVLQQSRPLHWATSLSKQKHQTHHRHSGCKWPVDFLEIVWPHTEICNIEAYIKWAPETWVTFDISMLLSIQVSKKHRKNEHYITVRYTKYKWALAWNCYIHGYDILLLIHMCKKVPVPEARPIKL